MNIDLFEFIERIFQGTVLFVFKYLATLWGCFRHPVRYPVEAYERFKSPEGREVGPVTFAALGLIAFWSFVVAAGFVPPEFSTYAIQLWAFDTSFLRQPFLMALAASIASLVVLELTFRLISSAFLKLGLIWEAKKKAFPENLRAVGLYATGAAGMMLPLVALAAWICATNVPSSVEHLSSETNLAIGMLGLGLIAPVVLCTTSILGFINRQKMSGGGLLYAMMGAVFIGFSVAWIAVVVAGGTVVFQIYEPLSAAGRPQITSLQCKSSRAKKETVALIEIKNNSAKLAMVQTATWWVQAAGSAYPSEEKKSFEAKSTRVLLDDKLNPETLLIKPNSAVYGVIAFPEPADDPFENVFLFSCDVRGVDRSLTLSVTGTFIP